MGYTAFTVTLRDQRRLAYVVGNALDFPALPPGVTTDDIVDAEPHSGRDAFHGRKPRPDEQNAPYAWCLYRPWDARREEASCT